MPFDNKKFEKWRQRAVSILPEASRRVFALRGISYYGCGTHWSVEKELGNMIAKLNNHDEYPHNISTQIIIQIRMQLLMETIHKAEMTVHEN